MAAAEQSRTERANALGAHITEWLESPHLKREFQPQIDALLPFYKVMMANEKARIPPARVAVFTTEEGAKDLSTRLQAVLDEKKSTASVYVETMDACKPHDYPSNIDTRTLEEAFGTYETAVFIQLKTRIFGEAMNAQAAEPRTRDGQK
jgi:hypothetical protein